MNKKLWVNVLVFAIGTGIGFFAAKKMLEDRYNKLSQEEIDSVKAAFEARLKKLEAERDNASADDQIGSGKTEEPKPVLEKEGTDIGGRNPYVRARTAYHEMAKEVVSPNISPKPDDANDKEEYSEELITDAAGYAEHDFTDSTSRYIPPKIDRSKPYVISDEEFSTECQHFDKVTLYYYSFDDTLCDEHEEIIDDLDNTVGWDCFPVLETQTTVWVRNEKISVDYEICLVRGSYAEVIQGIRPTENLSPRERYQRKKKENNEE